MDDDADDADAGADAVDPLDAFMATLETTAARATTAKAAARRMDADEDADDAFARCGMMIGARARAVGARGRARAVDAAVDAAVDGCDAVDADGRETDGRVATRDACGTVDHASMTYDAYVRATYVVPKELAELTVEAVEARREALDVRVDGETRAPVERFGQGGALDVHAIRALKRLGYETPTGIQAQCIPVICGGRDALGLATTGSGKTLAFLLPAYAQISRQRPLRKKEGPMALVLAPTRELATQIANEANAFNRAGVPARCCAIFGGASKHEQLKRLRAGAEIVVATPGRLIDVLHVKNSIDLRRVTYLALDEADRMLDMGFERAVLSICRAVRPDAQRVMFSATMPRNVRWLVNEVLADDFVTISHGQVGTANDDVRQLVHVFEDEVRRAFWFFERVGDFVNEGQTLVFVSQKSAVDELVKDLREMRGVRAVGLHGDMDQAERQSAMKAFKGEQAHVLVATDVAARGLHVQSIKTVVNLHPARDISTHVHRIGRTGRAGATDGVAYTLLTPLDCSPRFASQLERGLEDAGQQVPLDLKALARGSYNKRPRSDDHGEPLTHRHGKVGGRGVGFVGARAPTSAPHGGGRGARPIPRENFTAVPPPPSSETNFRSHQHAEALAQARARAESIAAQLVQPPPPPSIEESSSAASAAIAAARAIAARLTAAHPPTAEER